MNLLLLLFSSVAFLHGVRDIMQFAGMKNFITQFLHVYDNRNMEIVSAVASFLIGGLLFWLSLF